MSKTGSVERSQPDVADRIGRIKERWFINEPALLLIVSTHELTPNPKISGFRCGMGRIEYNPADAQASSDTELETALKAETIRIMFRHPYRYPPRNASISYIASNITINELYNDLDLPYKAGDFWSEWEYKRQFFEFYYKALCELFNRESTGGSERSDANAASQADEGLSQAAEKTELWATDEYFDEKIKEQIQIILGNSKQWGTLSGKLISQLTADMKPVMNYKKVLSGFRASVLSGDRILTRFKPSRRYGDLAMGRRLEFTTSLLVGVDVSGSVADRELKVFFSAINVFLSTGSKPLTCKCLTASCRGGPSP
ncbi:MAG: hypothetical protein LBK56_13500 [Gracilibacteraceae bacterium]|jgi:predicted metal-dependent peptidase|nr:hypothetical protein [Gracilibacteraceae bacterium]